VIDCRIAGQSGTGTNVIGLHVPVIILDEAGYYNWGTWVELLPCINSWQEGYQFFVSGVPTGIRERSVLFFADMKDEKFSKHRVSAFDNPRYTEADNITNIKQFGGTDSEDYIHLVLGEHGTTSFTMFDRERMLIKDYDIFHGSISGQKLREDPMYLGRLYSSLPRLPKNCYRTIAGIDLGYTDPSVCMVLYKYRETDPWRFLFRLQLLHVDYPTQERIIDYLASIYKLDFLGIDEGSSGKAVLQHLMNDLSYKGKNYKKRIIPIQFRSTIKIGFNEDGEEIKIRAKQLGMQLLQSKTHNHELVYSWKDEAVISELERTTYRKTPAGELIFTTLTPTGGKRRGQDHNISALLCFVLALYMVEEACFLNERRSHLGDLFKPAWF